MFTGSIAFRAMMSSYPSLDKTVQEAVKFDSVPINDGDG